MFPHVEEYVDPRSDWADSQRLRYEVRDSIIQDGILLVVQGADNMSGLLDVINGGVFQQDLVPHKKRKFQEGPELDCPAVDCALGVI